MSPDELGVWRNAERKRLIDARMSMPLEEHAAASEAITQHLGDRFPAASLPSLGCYWPFRREFNCMPLMQRIIDRGGWVALPVVLQKNHPLEFRRWTPETKMEAGVWKILHPAEGEPVHPTALLIPLVGFDTAGYRLGYGAGYYDRTLSVFPHKPLTIGVGFELSRMPTIHPQPHDVPIDYIVTEAGIVHTAAALH